MILLRSTKLLSLVSFLLIGFAVSGQATVTVEVNWPNWSSENRVMLYDSSNNLLGTVCDPTNCFNGAANSPHSSTTNFNVPYGNGYYVVLEDSYGDGWNGTGSYVRVFVDGVSTIENDGKNVFVNGVYVDNLPRTLTFDILNVPTSFNAEISIFEKFTGTFDYATTGNTLRTNPNSIDACSITTSSSGTLTTPIPATATIQKAYLYWVSSGINIGYQVLLDGQVVNADKTYRSYSSFNQGYFGGGLADVTTIVQASPDETFDFSGLTIDNSLQYCTVQTVLGSWSLFVFYEDSTLPDSSLILYNLFKGQNESGENFALNGFIASGAGASKATFLTWEGDTNISGFLGSFNEQLRFNGTILSGDGSNSGDNAYNSTNYDAFAAIPNNSETFYGLDLDTFDVSPYIQIGSTSAVARVEVGQEFVISNAVLMKVPTGVNTDDDDASDLLDLDDDNDGITDTQELCGTNPIILPPTATITITVDLDNKENETSWKLEDATSTIIASGGPYSNPDEVITQNIIVTSSQTYTFTIFDSFVSGGDGLYNPGGTDSNGTAGYSIDLDGINLFTSIDYPNFGSSSEHLINAIIPNYNRFSCLTSDPSYDEDGDDILNYKDADYATANGSSLNSNGVMSSLDHDGDGIINSLDLDSDNDGIYDLLEGGALNVSGVEDTNEDGVIDDVTSGLAFGDNGVYDVVETTTDSGILNYVLTNTDGTDQLDYFDLDSDNDSCMDVREAGFSDENEDGLLGPDPIVVDSDGLVINGTGGYSFPLDGDVNGVLDFMEIGIPSIITIQPEDAISCPGCSRAISISSDADNFKWQWFDGSIWVNLTDSTKYSGTETNVLIINNVDPSDDGNQYRVALSKDDYLCPVFSEIAILTVRVNTVITNRRITFRVNRN